MMATSVQSITISKRVLASGSVRYFVYVGSECRNVYRTEAEALTRIAKLAEAA